jgi:hypothetical protein
MLALMLLVQVLTCVQMACMCGFRNVMHVIRDAGKPLLGRNCFFDSVYTLAQFGSDVSHDSGSRF